MSRRPAIVTQADIARTIRAAKQAGAAEVEVRIENAIFVIRLTLSTTSTAPLEPSREIVLWYAPCLAYGRPIYTEKFAGHWHIAVGEELEPLGFSFVQLFPNRFALGLDLLGWRGTAAPCGTCALEGGHGSAFEQNMDLPSSN
jgi:hypothetical protein